VCNKHPKVCNVAAHGKGKIPKATCTLWHMRVPFARTTRTQGNFTGGKNCSNPPPGSKGNNINSKLVRPAIPDLISKLETEAKAEELQARIRMAKEQRIMMLPGITYRQVAEGHIPPLSTSYSLRTTRPRTAAGSSSPIHSGRDGSDRAHT
jgi:hypothetical protein